MNVNSEINDLFRVDDAPRGQKALATGAKWLLHDVQIDFYFFVALGISFAVIFSRGC